MIPEGAPHLPPPHPPIMTELIRFLMEFEPLHRVFQTYFRSNADPESLRAAAAELIALRPDVMNAMAHPASVHGGWLRQLVG